MTSCHLAQVLSFLQQFVFRLHSMLQHFSWVWRILVLQSMQNVFFLYAVDPSDPQASLLPHLSASLTIIVNAGAWWGCELNTTTTGGMLCLDT